jgi:hypothetical protein
MLPATGSGPGSLLIISIVAVVCGTALVHLTRRSSKAAAATVIALGVLLAVASATPTSASSSGCVTTTTSTASGVGAGSATTTTTTPSPATTSTTTTTTTTVPPCQPAVLPTLAWELIEYNAETEEFVGFDPETEELILRLGLTQASADALDAFLATATTPSPSFEFGSTGTATYQISVTAESMRRLTDEDGNETELTFTGSASSPVPFGPADFSLEPDESVILRVLDNEIGNVQDAAYNEAQAKIEEYEIDNGVSLDGGEESLVAVVSLSLIFSPATVFDGCNTTNPVFTPVVDVEFEAAAAASDARVKRDIVLLTRLDNGIQLYSFRYRSDDPTVYVGVIAQELLGTRNASAVHVGPNETFVVDYAALGLRMVTLEDYLSDPNCVFAENSHEGDALSD